MRRKMIMVSMMLLMFFLGSISSQAAAKIQEIRAYLNNEITFLLNGAKWKPTDANGKPIAAITYNGTTYVPLRAVSQAFGVPVEYNSVNKQVILGEKKDYVSFLDKSVGLDKKKSYYTTSVTRNASELNRGGKQYQAAFKLEEVNSNQKRMTIDFGKAYTRGHIVVAANFAAAHSTMKFRVLNDDDVVLYEGTLTKEEPFAEVDFNITGMTRYLSVDFVASVDGYSTGYVLLDDSWVK
ncbi:stalk domain-containing protein [Paenibacillus xylaniclasticus]|uniref:stalk domain-containing protein n=1 Tax=Paenibacillus xylaniclasticus TaxID=588083 RepID=UPI000FDCCB22|nr:MULTISPECIES: stalk domain-containing protein [Paenibacillus]GFN31438.1 hypothetical protein PCURB6_16980 [Paenibacillus curdlanolyticus]